MESGSGGECVIDAIARQLILSQLPVSFLPVTTIEAGIARAESY